MQSFSVHCQFLIVSAFQTVASTADMSRCYRFLVLHYLKTSGDLEQAENYAHKCCEFAEVRSNWTLIFINKS